MSGKINNEGQLESAERAAGVRKREQDTDLRERLMLTPLQYQIFKMPLSEPGTGRDAMSVWKLMTPAERQETAKVFARKIAAAYKSGSLDKADALKIYYQVAPYLQQAPAAAPAGAQGVLGRY